MKKYFLLILGLIVSLFLYKKYTHSYFTDTALSTANTFASGNFPTPTAIPSLQNNIVINEVYYKIAAEHRMGSEADSEWAELYNTNSYPVLITNFALSDNTDCDNFTVNMVIPGHGLAIVSTHTETEFKTVWINTPVQTVFIQSPTAIGGGLADNDELKLIEGTCINGIPVDYISWGSNKNGLNPSIPKTNKAGISTQRNPIGTDTNSNTDFKDNEPPTPGSE